MGQWIAGRWANDVHIGSSLPASDHAWRGCPAKAAVGGSQGRYREALPIALSRGWIRGCSYRLELDFGPERECSGLEGQPGGRLRRVGELPHCP